MIEIYPNTKIYIAAPARVFTGGPELLHQLAYHLNNDLKIDTYMYYYPNIFNDPIHPNFKGYNIKFTTQLEDKKNNILIVPEIKNQINLLQFYYNIRKVIWWLSVDNFYLSNFINKPNILVLRLINKIHQKVLGNKLFDIEKVIINKKINTFILPKIVKECDYHFAQSFYALSFLKNKEISADKTYYLSDYLNELFLETKTDSFKKENIVAYNPKKGLVFTQKLISYAKDIKLVPLINMNREGIINMLQKAKVYIDFGNHPGKDRIPREAAILGCCIITGKRGSAAFFEDVPIPDEYKFEDKVENIPKIIEKIKDCLENFEKRYKDFEYYREVIKNEPRRFLEDLKRIFVKV